MENLIAHIKAENVKIAAWIAEDPENRWAGFYVEDTTHWEDRNILNLEDFQRDELLTYIYEGTKDFFGYKPSMTEYNNMSLEELEVVVENLSKEIDAQIETDKAEEQTNISQFEARIKVIGELLNSSDRKHIIEVIADAEGICKEELSFYGWETLEYNLNIPYGYIKESIK